MCHSACTWSAGPSVCSKAPRLPPRGTNSRACSRQRGLSKRKCVVLCRGPRWSWRFSVLACSRCSRVCCGRLPARGSRAVLRIYAQERFWHAGCTTTCENASRADRALPLVGITRHPWPISPVRLPGLAAYTRLGLYSPEDVTVTRLSVRPNAESREEPALARKLPVIRDFPTELGLLELLTVRRRGDILMNVS